MEVTNPKRKLYSPQENTWYPYYAGYSPEFVKDVITNLNIEKSAIIMDPWNGSGTTTSVSMNMGLNCLGFDINPVMVLVAKSRCLNQSVQQSMISIGRDIIDQASYLQEGKYIVEPLETWFEPESAQVFRNLERAIRHILIDNEEDIFPYYMDLNQISSLASFYYVALFRTLRDELEVFKTSNPTWIKKPKNSGDHLSVDRMKINARFLSYITNMSMLMPKDNNFPVSHIKEASSINIPIDSATIDAVITSPPYCTRIDYAIATLPELALMGCSLNEDVKKLRHQMIGSPVIDKTTPERQIEWGESCIGFLKKVEEHCSVSSSTYYLKNYLQYFDLMFNSLSEINRTLKKSGSCTLVLQESYYKDIFLDLPGIIEEMTKIFSWKQISCRKFGVKNSMVDLNKRAKKYLNKNNAQESVLIFRRS